MFPIHYAIIPIKIFCPIGPPSAILPLCTGGHPIDSIAPTLTPPTQASPQGSALASLTARHLDLVYASALRQTRDPHIAADVTQAVFTVLATRSRANRIPKEAHMAGWLLKVTHFTVKETRRAAIRRTHHEHQAAAQPRPQPNLLDPEISAHLDQSLLKLAALDRELLIRRYLQGQGVQQAAAAVGLTENTAGHRLSRALEKLRKLLARRGMITPAALLALLATQSAIKAPAAALAGSTASAGLAKVVLWRMTMAKFFSTSLAAGALVAIGTGALTASLLAGGVAQKPPPPAGPIASQPATQAATSQPLLTVTSVVEENSDKLLQEVLAGIEENRKKLLTLEIHSISVSETLDRKSGEWTLAGRQEGTAWMELAEPRRTRIDAPVSHLRWTAGAAPYFDESFVEAWDGSQLRQRLVDSRPNTIPRGTIQNKRQLMGAALLGAGYSLQLRQNGFSDGRGTTRVEDPLDPAVLKLKRLAARRVILHGTQAAQELEVKEPMDARHVVRYWFDPTRGYALLGQWGSTDGVKPFTETIVDAYVEAAPGVFYPSHAASLSAFTRETFTATKVVANGPFLPDTFTLTFEPRLQVDEEINGGMQSTTRR